APAEGAVAERADDVADGAALLQVQGSQLFEWEFFCSRFHEREYSPCEKIYHREDTKDTKLSQGEFCSFALFVLSRRIRICAERRSPQRRQHQPGAALHRLEDPVLAQAAEVKRQADVGRADDFDDALENARAAFRPAEHAAAVAHHRVIIEMAEGLGVARMLGRQAL